MAYPLHLDQRKTEKLSYRNVIWKINIARNKIANLVKGNPWAYASTPFLQSQTIISAHETVRSFSPQFGGTFLKLGWIVVCFNFFRNWTLALVWPVLALVSTIAAAVSVNENTFWVSLTLPVFLHRFNWSQIV